MEQKLDLRVQKTYLALHNAFTELLEEKRFEDFTVNELCDKAMIRRTTFYKHFADKYEYFTFYLKEICENFQAALPPDTLSEDINAYFLQMSSELLHFIFNHKKIVNHISESELFPILLNILSEHITQDIIQTYNRINTSSQMDATRLESIAAFYAGGLLNMLLHWIRPKKEINDKIFLQIISDLTAKSPLA